MAVEDLKQRIRNGEFIIGVSAPITSTRDDLARILEGGDYGFVSPDS